MKMSTPITDEEKEAADKAHAQTARNQKKLYAEIADKISREIDRVQPEPDPDRSRLMLREDPEVTVTFSLHIAELVAGTLRHFADLIPEKRPIPRGRPPKIRDEAPFIYLAEVKSGKTPAEAYEQTARQLEIDDIESLRKHISRWLEKDGKDIMKVFKLE